MFGSGGDKQQPTSSLFGSAGGTPSSGLFGGTNTGLLGGTTSQLGGRTAQPAGGLFGSQGGAQSNIPTTGLFGGSSATQKPSTFGDAEIKPTTATPSGSLFGNSGTSLFGGPKAPSSNSQPASIFGMTNPTTAPSTSLFGSSQPAAAPKTSLFGASQSAATSTATPTSSLFGTFQPAATTSAPASSLFGTSQPAGTTAAPTSSLFGTPQTTANLTTPTTSLFNTAQPVATATANPPTSNLFGTPATATTVPKTASTLFGSSEPQSSTQTNLTLAPGTSAGAPLPSIFASTSPSPAVGSAVSQPTTAQAPASGLFDTAGKKSTLFKPATAAKETTEESHSLSSAADGKNTFLPAFGGTSTAQKKVTEEKKQELAGTISIATTLESCQYERIDDLLKSWESRLKRQVAAFGKFSEAVMALDIDLCSSVETLEKLQKSQAAIGTKQQEIDLSLDQLEKQQLSLAEILQKLQRLLDCNDNSGVNKVTHPLQGKLLTISTNLDDSEAAINELVADVNKLQDTLHPGAFGEIIELMNIQHRTVTRLGLEADSLRERINQLDGRAR